MVAPARPRLIAIEGPAGAGKTALAHRLAGALGYRAVVEPTSDNPFLEPFLRDPRTFALQAQLFFLLQRRQMLEKLGQGDLFSSGVVTDVLLERDRVQAALHLLPEERALYDKIWSVVHERVPRPDLVIFLQARHDVLLDRLRARRASAPVHAAQVEELCRVYNDFFFHYDASPLLIVNTNDVDLGRNDVEVRALAQEVLRPRGGTRSYVPRPG